MSINSEIGKDQYQSTPVPSSKPVFALMFLLASNASTVVGILIYLSDISTFPSDSSRLDSVVGAIASAEITKQTVKLKNPVMNFFIYSTLPYSVKYA